MDIRNWPIDKVMQLPDWCFGTRYVVGVTVKNELGAPGWDISEVAIPERAVLWEMTMWASLEYTVIAWIRIGLGDVLPTTTGQMDAYEQMLKGCGLLVAGQRQLKTFGAHVINLCRMKIPFSIGGRRLVMEIDPVGEKICQVHLITVWSAFPTEVPDWLISGQAKKL